MPISAQRLASDLASHTCAKAKRARIRARFAILVGDNGFVSPTLPIAPHCNELFPRTLTIHSDSTIHERKTYHSCTIHEAYTSGTRSKNHDLPRFVVKTKTGAYKYQRRVPPELQEALGRKVWDYSLGSDPTAAYDRARTYSGEHAAVITERVNDFETLVF